MKALLRALEKSWWRRPPVLLSTLLLPLAWLYGAVIAARRVRAERLDVPVLVVGNLIVGGAGKTPTTRAVVELLKAQGWHPGIVSRGYGRRGDDVHVVGPASTPEQAGDEPVLLQRRCAVPVVVARERAAAGRELRRLHPEVDIVVCDDGLQHRRLHHDLAIVVFDARGIGNGRLLPAGPLREPMPAAPRANWIVLYNAERAPTPWPGFLARRSLAGAVELGAWHAGASAERTALHALRDRTLVAAAGLAEPERFFRMLEAEGLRLQRLPLADHHDFAALPWPEGTSDVVVTEKDAIKLDPRRIGATRVWVAALDFQPEPAFAAELKRRLPAAGSLLPQRLKLRMDHRLIELLVCPLCKGPLQMHRHETGGDAELVCNADRLAFPVRDGLPVMLEAEARSLDARTTNPTTSPT